MTFNDAVSYLYSLGHETLAIKLGLKTTEVLLAALANPQTTYSCVQIAGTNGKGSTAVVLESICRSAGIKTALFTSPHLVSITERIRIAGEEIPQNVFADLATRVRETVAQLLATASLSAPPTFFEQVTAIALLAFAQSKVDLAILETGLGGRLDSTTVARADTIGITPIALDHQEYLGATLEEIAAEKAAVIRPGVTALIAPQEPAALEVILKQAADVNVVPQLSSFQVEGLTFSADGKAQATLKTANDTYPAITLGLRGRHQLTNTALAIQLAESLRARGFTIPPAAIVKGVEESRHPGRLELIEARRRVLLDGAHNPAGARALREYLDEFVHQPITMVFGAMRDKNLMEMTSTLFPRAVILILTEPDNPRAATLETLKGCASQIPGDRQVELERSAEKALQLAFGLSEPDALVCVTGSLYLIGEVRKLLTGNVC
jgi:dihydrofolate synthase / folylpolyglutamate synthase